MKWKSEELNILNLYRDGTKTIEQIREYLKKSGYKRTYKSVSRKLEALNIKKPLANYSNVDLPKILILDIETTPMGVWTWSLGKQYVGHHAIMKDKNGKMMDWNLLSWSAKWLYDDKANPLNPGMGLLHKSKHHMDWNEETVCARSSRYPIGVVSSR